MTKTRRMITITPRHKVVAACRSQRRPAERKKVRTIQSIQSIQSI
jgi:hypothetical protein